MNISIDTWSLSIVMCAKQRHLDEGSYSHDSFRLMLHLPSMRYDLLKSAPSEPAAPIADAGIALARLDERIARSPVGEGWIERSHFAEACAHENGRAQATICRRDTTLVAKKMTEV
ncbi:hypothetical protein [Sinorhizobium fredii]|nr:hypothetical protein [Sinorhizobium fredii]